MNAKAVAKEAATDLATNLEDKDSQAALRIQLRKLLEKDKALASQLAQILEDSSNRPSVAQIT
ncbi:MAG: hypothetical protein WA949_05240 [Phormidesmis sp.]